MSKVRGQTRQDMDKHFRGPEDGAEVKGELRLVSEQVPVLRQVLFITIGDQARSNP